MQNALWLASIFGPFLMILGVWKLLCSKEAMKVCTSMKANPCCVHMMGVINVLVGLTILSQFQMWSMGLSVLVTLFGWVVLIRGLLALFAPHYLCKKNMSHKNCLKVKGVIALVWGFGMCWLAFWM